MISNAGGSMAIAAANAAPKDGENKPIGVMVGGPIFLKHPELAMRVKADAAAVSAPTAVILAQKLLDLSVSRAHSWRGCVLAAT